MQDSWAPNGLDRLGRCPVCRSRDRSVVHEHLSDNLFHAPGSDWVMHACRSCGTHYLDPRPAADSIHVAYANYPTHEAPAAGTELGRSVAERVRHVARALANGYRNARWRTHLEPQHGAGARVVPLVPPLADAIEQQMRSLPSHGPGHDRLLDVGCGSGEFLQLARSAGWKVQGIDFDPVAVEAARSVGLEVQQGGLEWLEAADAGSFDFVSLSHVLEHVHDPMRWLAALHRILAPGGTLWLQTPNVESVGHERYGRHWRGLEPPRHLTLWTLATLESKLRETGFASVGAKPTPVTTAMELYAASEALARGIDYAAFMASRSQWRRRWHHIAPALRQHRDPRRSEFHTLVAKR